MQSLSWPCDVHGIVVDCRVFLILHPSSTPVCSGRSHPLTTTRSAPIPCPTHLPSLALRNSRSRSRTSPERWWIVVGVCFEHRHYRDTVGLHSVCDAMFCDRFRLRLLLYTSPFNAMGLMESPVISPFALRVSSRLTTVGGDVKFCICPACYVRFCLRVECGLCWRQLQWPAVLG